MNKLKWWKAVCAVSILWATTAIAAPAQSFNILLDFTLANGARPQSTLVQGADGNLYGTTQYGGANNYGTVFKMSPTGVLTTLYSFCAQTYCSDGTSPTRSLVLGTDGNFYGTTETGGTYNFGTVFRITPIGKLTTLHSFVGEPTEGSLPYAGLVEATDGNFYGTTLQGGNGFYGTIFRITPSGTFTMIYNVCAHFGCADGSTPSAPLIQASDGYLYGSTDYGGSTIWGDGTVFKITLDGTLTTLHSFGLDLSFPNGALVQGSDGNIYGATAGGGGSNCSGGCGAIFSIDPEGTLTLLHQFNSTDGANPNGGLLQVADGSFYGISSFGGVNYWGTAFRFAPGGKFIVLHSFDATEAAYPSGALVQATNGNFYGTTDQGGAGNCGGGCGTVFMLAAPSPHPFVKTVPIAGVVGQFVTILGTKLAGATNVTFNGSPASFTASKSGTYIKTSVPAGATTGTVQVVTPNGTLTSDVNFRVVP